MPAGFSTRLPLVSKILKRMATLVAVLPMVALAQTPIRVIPADAPVAKLVVAAPGTGPQQVKLGDNVIGVAPGLRIFGPDNMLLNPLTVVGRKLPVRYKLDLYGQLLTAWVLNETELQALKASR